MQASYLTFVVFSNGNKNLGLIGKTMNSVNKVGNFLGGKNGKPDGEGGEAVKGTKTEAVKGTKTEAVEGGDEQSKIAVEKIQQQMAFSNSYEDDGATDTSDTGPSKP